LLAYYLHPFLSEKLVDKVKMSIVLQTRFLKFKLNDKFPREAQPHFLTYNIYDAKNSSAAKRPCYLESFGTAEE